jgi:hypothetical protein
VRHDELLPGQKTAAMLANFTGIEIDMRVITYTAVALLGFLIDIAPGDAQLVQYTVATLPSASSNPAAVVQVTDGANASDCTAGLGSFNVVCTAQGSIWVPVNGTSGSPFLSLSGGSLTGQLNGFKVTQSVMPSAISSATTDATMQNLNNAADLSVMEYGADNTGATCTDAAIQSTINAAAGAPVVIPQGKYLLCAPLYWYTTPGTNGGAAGLKIVGRGYGNTQLLISPSSSLTPFTVPPTITVGGIAVPVTPAVIDIQGTLISTNYGKFQNFADIGGLEIAPQGCEVNPGVGEPPCAFPSQPIAGIAIEGCWKCHIHDNWINFLSSDGIVWPARLDIGTDPDWWASGQNLVERNHIIYNEGWGVNDDGSNAVADLVLQANYINTNSLGGVRETGWGNSIIGNSIAGNGCGQTLAGIPTAPITCTTFPLGPNILIDRAWYPEGGGLNGKIENNELDSGALAQVAMQNGTNYTFKNNRFIQHTTAYAWNNSFGPGIQNAPNQSFRMGGGTGGANLTIQNSIQRSDYYCAAGYPTPSVGCGYGNALLDPEVATFNFGDSARNYLFQNLIRYYNNTANLQPYSQGAGMVANAPTMSAGTVSSWMLSNGGLGYGVAPTLTVVGGDSAWTTPTLVSITTSGGVPNYCSIKQAGGPYNRPPLTSVTDQYGTGSGATLSITLSGGSSGTPTSCSVSGGTGYGNPVGGVAPVCATQPTVTATASLGIDYISITGGGNYGAWTPGSTAPTVTATVTDVSNSSNTSATVTPVLRPVNTNTSPTTATVYWEVVGYIVTNAGYNYTAPASTTGTWSSTATSMTVASATGIYVGAAVSGPGIAANTFVSSVAGTTIGFSVAATSAGTSAPVSFTPTLITFSATGLQTAATAAVALGHMLNPSLTVTNAGSCDSGTTPWLIVNNPAYASSNSSLNTVIENNKTVSSPPQAATSSLTLQTGSDTPVTSWNCGSNNECEMASATTSSSVAAVVHKFITHQDTSGNGSGLIINTDATGSSVDIYTYAAGADPVQALAEYAGTGANFEFGSNGMFDIIDDYANLALRPVSAGGRGLGTVSAPFANAYLGASSTANVKLAYGGSGTGTATVLPSTNTVVPLASAPTGGCVGYIDSSGVQHSATCSSGGPAWNARFGFQYAVIPSPIATDTYWLGSDGASMVPTPGSSPTAYWPASAPVACTVRAVQYYAFIAGTLDTGVNNVTLSIYDVTTSSNFSDTTATVAFNGSHDPTIAPITGLSTDSIALKDKLELRVVMPASWTTQPTNVNFGATLFCY